ncbi:divalent-cation tolerance protein CutA [Parerythrobacter jejuensis]|uniref:Divalent cation tolerance protein CutA n=1 Tax=Parerythrobacter jejuensis TaxID=795812 RepID=A0A845AWS5_9SPHN|nr:divalent-cation tolerance protein CutA [Parerythrobacter jejuensis]MXP30977.1 divalent cation tolerance protein CutA [Parerythrobacter jejuensis]MXP33737.1 divalent cation tolerance protein CutA [Parerythrobacter jejuensis]
MSAMIWAPFPDHEAARTAAGILLDEKLVACANILGSVESIFDWGGERTNAAEIGVLFKTDATILDQAVARIEDLHPYKAPAILGWRADAPARATRDWLGLLAGKIS